jgi:hypothetical protein
MVNDGIDRQSLLMLNHGSELVGDNTLELYTNNHAPDVADVAGDYIVCTAAGYDAETLLGASWAGGTSAGVSSYEYPVITFTMTDSGGGETIYGVVMFDPSGNVVGAALLPTPFVIPPSGGTVTIALVWSNKQCAGG